MEETNSLMDHPNLISLYPDFILLQRNNLYLFQLLLVMFSICSFKIFD